MTVEVPIVCTARGHRRSAHPQRILGYLLDARTPQPTKLETAMHDIDEIDAWLGWHSPIDQKQRAARNAWLSANKIMVRGDFVTTSADGAALLVPPKSTSVTINPSGTRRFQFTCPSCGLVLRMSEEDACRLADAVRRGELTQADISLLS